jgi:hypothetical protein
MLSFKKIKFTGWLKVFSIIGLLLVSMSALSVYTMGENKAVAQAGGYYYNSCYDVANDYYSNCVVTTNSYSQNQNVVPQNNYNNYTYNRCNSGNQQIFYGQNSSMWCAYSYPTYSCGYFYKAQTGYDGFCNTGGDTSFDKSDIVPFETNIDCYPGGFKLYYYSRREGGRQNNYKGPLVCAYYPNRSRAELRWLPQTYTIQPF